MSVQHISIKNATPPTNVLPTTKAFTNLFTNDKYQCTDKEQYRIIETTPFVFYLFSMTEHLGSRNQLNTLSAFDKSVKVCPFTVLN